MRRLAIGLISGTSQDAIDAALAAFDDDRFVGLVATHEGRYPTALRQRLLALAYEDRPIELADWTRLDRDTAICFADTAGQLLAKCGVSAAAVHWIGSHGQTVFHDPDSAGGSLQLGDPSLIAARTGITTIADFRRKDIALGGQGAPLVPAFHHSLFAHADEPRAVLNIGGIANLTLLPNADAQQVRGFDSGPGNALMDEWISQHLDRPFDQDGAWADEGTVLNGLLERWLDDPYFQRHPPKSTGRGQFRLGWAERLGGELKPFTPADVQRSFCELTARSVAQALMRELPEARRLLVCGGGAHNRLLMGRLQALLPGIAVESTERYGLHPNWVEAAAFAWLAVRRALGLPGSLSAVTGASADAVLGGIFLPR